MVVSEISPISAPEEAVKAATSSVSVLSAAPKVSGAAFDSSSFRSQQRQAPASTAASAEISSVLANVSASAVKAQTASLAPSSSEAREAVFLSGIATAVAASAPSEGAAPPSDSTAASGQAVSSVAVYRSGDTVMTDSGRTGNKPLRKVQRRDMAKRREQNRLASQKYRERRKQRGEAMCEMATELNTLKERIAEVERAEDRLQIREDAMTRREEKVKKLKTELEMERVGPKSPTWRASDRTCCALVASQQMSEGSLTCDSLAANV